MTENAGTAAPSEPTGPSFESFVAQLEGNVLVAEPESDAGTPPAADSAPADRSERDTTSAHADTPSADADGTAPDARATELPDALDASLPSDEPDPFVGAAPLGYTVDGQAKTFDGVTVLSDGRGIIDDPAQVEQLQRILGERDHLFAKDQQSYRQLQDLERATTWPTYDAQGKQTGEIRGVDALIAQRTVLARTLAAYREVDAVMKDPGAAMKLVSVVPTGEADREGNPTYALQWNADALDNLRTRMDLAAARAEQTAKSHLAAISAPPAPEPPSAASFAKGSIAQYEQSYGITGLTDADRAEFAGIFDRFVERDARGTPVSVDPRFVDALKARAALRAETAKTATAATTAATQNARNLAAAGLAKKAVAKAPVAPPAPSEDDAFGQAWDSRQKAASGALRARTFGM